MDIAENDFGVFQGAEGAWFGVGHRGISQFFKVLRQTVMESTLICYICNQRPPTPYTFKAPEEDPFQDAADILCLTSAHNIINSQFCKR